MSLVVSSGSFEFVKVQLIYKEDEDVGSPGCAFWGFSHQGPWSMIRVSTAFSSLPLLVFSCWAGRSVRRRTSHTT